MKYDDLRGILRYVPQFRGRIFVLSVDSSMVSPEALSALLLDVAVLHSLSIHVVIVFGARQQIAALATERGLTISSPDATDVTDDATLDVACDAISRIATEFLQQLASVGLRAAVPNCVAAHPAGVIRGRDLEHTGTVDRIDAAMLHGMIQQGVIPVIPPLGYERPNRTLRLDSAAVAVSIASELKAAKLMFLGVGIVLDGNGQRLRQLSVEAARATAETSVGAVPSENSQHLLLRHAARACEAGVARVHFLDGASEDALLEELFSIEGVGTMVYGDAYQNIRTARKADIDPIVRMVSRAVDDEEIVLRSRAEMRARIDDYYVLEVDGILVGVVSLRHWPDDHMGEVGCLYVRQSHEGMGYGSILVKFAEKRARDLRVERLFALSTQAYNYFEQKLGYTSATPDDLPPARREKLEKSGRNSRVMLKRLTSA
jgi:amino-acid N-acetyltransferase